MNPSHDLQGLKKKAKETFLYALSALLLGIAIGAIDAVFGRVLLFITDFRSAHVVVLLPFLPLAGLGIVWLYRHFNETASKGMTLVMEAGQGKRESIPLALIPLVMAGTWITHLFGGSAGREGVAVQIGATLSHAFARRFHFPDNGRIVLIAGMAAGFGGLFQTPFAAVFFAMEVVVSGSMAYSALLPAAIASFTASATSHALGLEKFSVLLSQTLSLTDTKTVTYLILFGILFGLTGRLFAVLLQKVKQFMGNVIVTCVRGGEDFPISVKFEKYEEEEKFTRQGYCFKSSGEDSRNIKKADTTPEAINYKKTKVKDFGHLIELDNGICIYHPNQGQPFQVYPKSTNERLS
jgi:H+/Cl- antiporter ClcA